MKLIPRFLIALLFGVLFVLPASAQTKASTGTAGATVGAAGKQGDGAKGTSAAKQSQPSTAQPSTAQPSKASGAAKASPASGGTAAGSSGSSAAAGGGAGANGAEKPKSSAAPTVKPPSPASGAGQTGGAGQSGAVAPPGTAPATIPGAPGAQPGASATDPGAYVVRLRDLESRVEELKEQIRRSHTRLSLLSESVLSAGVGGAQARIVFRNSMSNAFRVTGVLVVLDGAVQYNERGEDAPHLRQKLTPIFDGAVPPGDHTLQIVVTLQGHGYGVFSYLRGYTFEARSTHSFTIRQGKGVQLEAIAWEKGTVTTPLDQRPDVKFVESPLNDAQGADVEAR